MAGLDPVIHAPLRLRLVAMLAAVDAAEFATVRDALEVSDSVLSKQVSVLVEAGYARNAKSVLDGRRTTWLSLTDQGRAALRAHTRALRALLDGVDAGDAGDADQAGHAEERARPTA